MSIFKGTTEPKSIKIGIPHDDYSAMQGPCPSGFHVPLSSECAALCGILTTTFGLASNATTMGTYLKMPKAGYRSNNGSNVYDVDTSGRYSSSSSNGDRYCYELRFTSSAITPQGSNERTVGKCIRAFRDMPEKPDNSRTTLYDGSGVASGAGIFWNSGKGLISISGDGTTWYTIMDKNLGATTVYNNGDTLTDANCGNVFQRGNNYAFPGTKSSTSITTSSTQVNVTGYGPGNYYSSSTWITALPRQNSTSNGNNLRGGVTGIVQKTDTDIKKVYLGSTQVRPTIINFATQGPAPDGFHVPLNTDRQAVYNVWTGLGGGSSDGTNFGIALKLPFTGSRNRSNAAVNGQGTYGYYWSSSRSSEDGAYSLFSSSSALLPQYGASRAAGFSVRCFKNSPTTPTSSWTKLYGTSIESGGIFWSSTDGLISLSSDGQTWLTIQDKNLGATQVWNSGDTLSEANCGKYYQRGNNYGFPFTGSVTISYTRVNASTYGPGNYYSSSTFISNSGRWDTTDNGNLRGGVDGNVPV